MDVQNQKPSIDELAHQEHASKERAPDQPVDDLSAPPPAPITDPIGGRPDLEADAFTQEYPDVPPEPELYTATLPTPGSPEPVEGDQPSYEGLEPVLVLINPLATIQENAAKINERLIKQCLKAGTEYYFALNILRYCARTLGADWVRVRDQDKELPVIKDTVGTDT